MYLCRATCQSMSFKFAMLCVLSSTTASAVLHNSFSASTLFGNQEHPVRASKTRGRLEKSSRRMSIPDVYLRIYFHVLCRAHRHRHNRFIVCRSPINYCVFTCMYSIELIATDTTVSLCAGALLTTYVFTCMYSIELIATDTTVSLCAGAL